MPNPKDPAREGDAHARSAKLLASAGTMANSKSWHEWFSTTGGTWLGSAGVGYVTDLAVGQTRKKLFVTGGALAAAIVPGAGVFAALLSSTAGTVAVEAVGKKLEKMAKDKLPEAVDFRKHSIDDKSLDETIESIKSKSELVQELLDRMAGKAPKAHLCDDVFHLAILARKLEETKAELAKDIASLRAFLNQLSEDLDHVKTGEIGEKLSALAVDVCGANDSRHYRKTRTARGRHCSEEHCHGPK
jgi:hypothetical protein